MVLPQLSRVVEFVIGSWFALLLGVTVIQMFGGKILTTGLLTPVPGRRTTVGRMQLVLTTIIVAAGYAGAALTRERGQSLPDVPMGVVLTLLGSHGVYLGGKSRLSLGSRA